ncbi:lamin tail domain-containing protein [Geodermatophilus sp. SYSU D00697]
MAAVRKRIGAIVLALVIAVAGGVLAAAPAQAAPAVRIEKIYYNSPGTDTRSAASLNAEYVLLRNTTTRTQTITGWTVRDAAGWVYAFPVTTIAAGKSVVLRTGKGTNAGATRYWQRTNYVWNNDKDTAQLRTRAGALVHSCSYNAPTAVSRTC